MSAYRVLVRLATCCVVLALASACSTNRQVDQVREAAQYQAHARRDYTPPGPPNDPWGPYIVEAAAKYDVPERWVREVMRAESSGRLYENGQLITSPTGAMGLMQVEPGTFDELRGRYSLGDDPYDPHDNIMAGTAYIREMYDAFGTPAFLAAYNAGPGKLQDYLTNNKPLPEETRRYVAKIGPYISDSFPQRLSQASQYAINDIPVSIPPGPRYPSRSNRYGAPVALAENRSGRSRGSYQAQTLPEPPRYVPPQPQVVYASAEPPRARGGFHLIAPAQADTMPLRRGGPESGGWGIQVGAYASEHLARAAAESARGQVSLISAHPYVGTVRQANAVLYRARVGGLSHEAAVQACEHLSRGRSACIVVSPDSQS